MAGPHRDPFDRMIAAERGRRMNLMLTAVGYPWTVVPVEHRDTYMAALEAASVRQDIGPFTEFLAGLVGEGEEPDGEVG